MNDDEFLGRVKEALAPRAAGLHEGDPGARVRAAIRRARRTETLHRAALSFATAIGALVVVGAGIFALAAARPRPAPGAAVASPTPSSSAAATSSPAPSAYSVLDPGLPTGERITGVEGSPDGRFIAILAIPEGAPQGAAGIIRVLAASGTPVADASGTAIAWVSPTRLALVSPASRIVIIDVASGMRTEPGPAAGTLLGDGAGHLAVVSGTTTRVVDVTSGAEHAILGRVGLDWHGAKLLLVQPTIPWSNGAGAPSGSLSILDTSTDVTTALDPSLAVLFSARFSPDGDTVACDCFPSRGVEDALGVVPGAWLLPTAGGTGTIVEPTIRRDLGTGTPPFAWLADGDLAVAVGDSVRVVAPSGTPVVTRALSAQLAEGFVPAEAGSEVLATAYADGGVQPFTWLDGEGRTVASTTIEALTTPVAATTARGATYVVDPSSARVLLVLRP